LGKKSTKMKKELTIEESLLSSADLEAKEKKKAIGPVGKIISSEDLEKKEKKKK
jgi:hypothetical protein